MIISLKSVVLKSSLEEGIPGPDQFDIVSSEIAGDIPENSVLLQVLVISADPYLRGQIKSTGSLKPGLPMAGYIAGKVIQSKNANWQVGDFLGRTGPFSTFQVVPEEELRTICWKLTGKVTDATISYGIGVLGMPGSTAYGGLIDVLRPKQGETIFISAASGAVGSLVGLLAKNIFNCTVIGSCGGPQKCDIVTEELGFNHVIDYKLPENSSAEGLANSLKAVAPDGIDMYFENVGGIHFEAAMANLKTGGRVAVCGAISEYNLAAPPQLAIKNVANLIYKAQRVEGFLCVPWLYRQKGNFHEDMYQWLTEGKVVAKESFFDGIESWPTAFRALFTGENVGKVVVRV